MKTHIGLDLSFFASRAVALNNTINIGKNGCFYQCESFEPSYSPKCCEKIEDYPCADRWDDAMAFRKHSFNEKFEINACDKAVVYKANNAREMASEWLSAYVVKIIRQLKQNKTRFVVTLPDHAKPDDKDALLRTLRRAGESEAILLWRPIAAALAWLEDKKSIRNELKNRTVIVLDLDGPLPELTSLKLESYSEENKIVVPVRQYPKSKWLLRKSDDFNQRCYKSVLSDCEYAEQLMHGQFAEKLQVAIEAGDSTFDAWVRQNAAWRKETIALQAKLPMKVVESLTKWFKTIKMEPKEKENVIVLCVGWFARHYEHAFIDRLKLDFHTEDVTVLSADAIARGAAIFGKRLEEKLPTYYDVLPCYEWWNHKIMQWCKLFEKPRVEPGERSSFIQKDLSIPKYNDNVSFYVRIHPEGDEIDENDIFARRLKIHFSEFIKEEEPIKLEASVYPEEGSAKFTLEATRSIFIKDKKPVSDATLYYSEDPDSKAYSVENVPEHIGYPEPQPVLGRIYDDEETVKMVEAYCDPARSEEYNKLFNRYWEKYKGNNNKTKKIITQRVGFHSKDSPLNEPTRGLFGTKRIENERIDTLTKRFIESYRQKINSRYKGKQNEKYKLFSFLHSAAPDKFKEYIRDKLKENTYPFPGNYYYAPGYVLGDQSNDIQLLMNYILTNRTIKPNEKDGLWWSFFRMICWHSEVSLDKADEGLLNQCLEVLCEDANNGAITKKYLVLAILYSLRIRQNGGEIACGLQTQLANLLDKNGALSGVDFPTTMVNNLNDHDTGTLSAYVLRFLKYQESFQDRELGAAIGSNA